MGDRIAILREGGVLAQYDTPDAILAHPADTSSRSSSARTARCAGSRCAASAMSRSSMSRVRPRTCPDVAVTTTVRNAVSLMVGSGRSEVLVVGDDGAARRRAHPRPRRGAPALTAAGPVIPNFGHGSACVTGDHLFCWDWVNAHWGDTLQPPLVAARRADADRGRDRLRARVRARAPCASRPRARAADRDRRRADLHDPEHRALPASSCRSPASRRRRSRSRSSPTRS